MNQIIQALAEQAGLNVESWMTNPPKPFQILGSTEQFEKFVELIVQECADRIQRDTRINWLNAVQISRELKDILIED